MNFLVEDFWRMAGRAASEARQCLEVASWTIFSITVVGNKKMAAAPKQTQSRNPRMSCSAKYYKIKRKIVECFCAK